MIDGTTNCEFCLFVSFFAFFPELTHVEEALRGVGAGALKPHEGDEEGDGVGDPDEEDADPGQRHGHVQVRTRVCTHRACNVLCRLFGAFPAACSIYIADRQSVNTTTGRSVCAFQGSSLLSTTLVRANIMPTSSARRAF